MNQNEYNFGSWICIPIIAYLSYMVNYLLDGFFQKNQDVLMNGMKLFEQHLDQIMEYPFRVSSYYNERSFPAILIGIMIFLVVDILSFLCRKTMMIGKEYGTAQWGNVSEMRKRLSDKNEEANILFTQDLSFFKEHSDKHRGILIYQHWEEFSKEFENKFPKRDVYFVYKRLERTGFISEVTETESVEENTGSLDIDSIGYKTESELSRFNEMVLKNI